MRLTQEKKQAKLFTKSIAKMLVKYEKSEGLDKIIALTEMTAAINEEATAHMSIVTDINNKLSVIHVAQAQNQPPTLTRAIVSDEKENG